MGVVRFNGGSLKWTALAQALADVSDGAWTAAFVIKRAVDDTAFHGLGYLLSGTVAGTAEAGLSISNGDALLFDNPDNVNGSGPTITGTTEHYVVVCSKATGSAVPVYSRYVKSTAAWTHANASPANPNGDEIDATMLELGSWQEADDFNGWMAVAAFWEGAMSQADKEALVTNWRSSDLWRSAHGKPAFFVELNTATPTDLAGNASSRTTTGTAPTFDSGETFDGWEFDGTGPNRQLVSSYSFDAASDSRAVTIPPGCEVLEISIATVAAGVDQTGVTVGGQSMTKDGGGVHSGGKPRVNVWRLTAPPTGSQTVAPTNASADKTDVEVNSWTDIDAATPFDGFVSADGTSTTPASASVTSTTGDLVADSAGSLSAGAYSPTGGNTELFDSAVVAAGRHFGSTEAGAASVSTAWSSDIAESKEWVVVAWNANAPAAAGALATVYDYSDFPKHKLRSAA